jgi:hypothetical protein
MKHVKMPVCCRRVESGWTRISTAVPPPLRGLAAIPQCGGVRLLSSYALQGISTRSIAFRIKVSTNPMIAMTKRPTYICSTANVSQAFQIM